MKMLTIKQMIAALVAVLSVCLFIGLLYSQPFADFAVRVSEAAANVTAAGEHGARHGLYLFVFGISLFEGQQCAVAGRALFAVVGADNELGFDYLRDNMAIYKQELVQRGHAFAIVDEVDSILIDEARTPLIISGQGDESTDLYRQADDFVSRLKKQVYASVDEKEEEAEDLDTLNAFSALYL